MHPKVFVMRPTLSAERPRVTGGRGETRDMGDDVVVCSVLISLKRI